MGRPSLVVTALNRAKHWLQPFVITGYFQGRFGFVSLPFQGLEGWLSLCRIMLVCYFFYVCEFDWLFFIYYGVFVLVWLFFICLLIVLVRGLFVWVF